MLKKTKRTLDEFITPQMAEKIALVSPLTCIHCFRAINPKRQSFKYLENGDKPVHKKCLLTLLKTKLKTKFERDIELAQERLKEALSLLVSKKNYLVLCT